VRTGIGTGVAVGGRRARRRGGAGSYGRTAVVSRMQYRNWELSRFEDWVLSDMLEAAGDALRASMLDRLRSLQSAESLMDLSVRVRV
jgi:hypothetical protein